MQQGEPFSCFIVLRFDFSRRSIVLRTQQPAMSEPVNEYPAFLATRPLVEPNHEA